jgi:hypothetical protein
MIVRKEMTTKTHYKMYKSGKHWVFAGLISGALFLSAGVTAQADEQPGAATAATVTAVGSSESAPSAATAATDTPATTSEAPAASTAVESVGTTKPAGTVDDVVPSPVTPDETTTTTAVPAVPATPAVTVTADNVADTVTMPAPAADSGATTTSTTADPVGTTKPTGEADPVVAPIDPATPTTDEPLGTTKPAATVDPVTPATDDGQAIDAVPTATTSATPTVTVDPIVETAVVPTVAHPTLETAATTRPALDVTPVATADSVSVSTTRPDPTTLPDVLTTGWTQPAVALVQAELAKPATVATVAHTKETPAIDLWMPNKRLQQMVLLALQKLHASDKTWSTVDDITQEDLARLKKLVAVGHNGMGTYIDGHTAFSLVGLEHAVNLETLMLTNTLNVAPGAFFGDIEDVTPLANLQQLTVLDLQHNRIKDVTPLANLKHLKQLALAYNAIQDFSPLKDTVPREPGSFTDTGQFIFLDPVLINEADRTGHLQAACTTIDGEVVQLTATAAVAQPLFHVNEQSTYHVYFTGGNPQPDGQGGVNYTYIQDQKPGATSWPGDDSIHVDPLTDYYYLTGVYKPFGSIDFAVIQPYAIAHNAANVTVHHVDETGEEIAPAETLKPGLVGETYTTTPVTVPHYVLQTTPANATGVYGETAIDVTYIYAEEEADTEEGGNTTPPGTDGGGNTTTPGQPGQPGEPGQPSQPGQPEQPGQPSQPEQPGQPAPAPGGETPGGDHDQQPGDPGDGQSDGNQGGSQGNQPGTQGTGDQVTGSHPGSTTPGTAPQPGTTGTAVTDDAAEDTALPGLTAPSTPDDQAPGQTSQVTALAHSHARPTLPTGTSVAAASTSPTATTLPQTSDHATSAIWGVALLTGMLGWLGVKLKRQRH